MRLLARSIQVTGSRVALPRLAWRPLAIAGSGHTAVLRDMLPDDDARMDVEVLPYL